MRFLSFTLLVTVGNVYSTYSVGPLAEFVSLNYTWDSAHSYQDYSKSQKYLPENCLLAGIKVDHEGNIYVTVPRWKSGIPATLNKLSADHSGVYSLAPYPSWDMQREGVSGDLQNCQSMFIDSLGRMWIIEVGRRNFFMGPRATVNGPAGVWLLDMNSGVVLSKYYFPNEIVPYDSSFLDDIVVDESLEIAYLTDAGFDEGALIVYDLKTQSSRRFAGASTQNEPGYVMIINGVNYGNKIFTTPVDGIALSADKRFVYYCAVQGTALYRVPADLLRNFSATADDIDASVVLMGSKPPSDGIMFLKDELFYGSLPESTFYSVTIIASSSPGVTDDAVAVPANQDTMQWVCQLFWLTINARVFLCTFNDAQVDTFSSDPTGAAMFYFVSNKLDEFIVGTMDFTGKNGPNMRIMR
jgi:hypothetical protein